MTMKTASSSKKILDIIKNGGKGLLPQASRQPDAADPSPAPSQPGFPPEPQTDEALEIHSLKLLARMRRSLDNIWGNIVLKMQRRDDHHLLFTGCAKGDGASFVSYHLSMFLAMEHNLKILYVDTDLERGPRDPAGYSPPGHPGLANFFMANASLDDLILTTNVEGFCILPSGAGTVKVASSNIMARQSLLDDLFAYAQIKFDLIIYDCKPVTLSPLALAFAKRVNHVFMVCRYADSRREVCLEGIERFRENSIEVSGMILNDRRFPIPPIFYDLLK